MMGTSFAISCWKQSFSCVQCTCTPWNNWQLLYCAKIWSWKQIRYLWISSGKRSIWHIRHAVDGLISVLRKKQLSFRRVGFNYWGRYFMLAIFVFEKPLWVIVFDHTRSVTNPLLLDNLNPLNPPNLARWSMQLTVQFRGRAVWIYHICRPLQKDLRERPFGKRVALLHWSLWLGVLVKYVSVVHCELYGSWSKYPFQSHRRGYLLQTVSVGGSSYWMLHSRWK